MHKAGRLAAAALLSGSMLTLMLTVAGAAQTPRSGQPAVTVQMSEKDTSELQDKLLQLLRLSPTLAEVVARDPSLLANQQYVSHNNPELGQFLQQHPEIAQNPEFYLFNNLHPEHEQPAQTLERKLWPGMSQQEMPENAFMRDLINDGIPFLVFLCVLSALLWLTHVMLENRRWGKMFKLQTDVHGKLLERFGTSQEVLTYMGTDAGKKFLEATPIAAGIDRRTPVPSPVARVLTPLQIGIVMTLLGAGLLGMRHSVKGADEGLMVLGMVVLMPGIGFIISAAITWFLARHLGLMPQSGEHHSDAA